MPWNLFYLVSSSPSDELRIVLYCELRVRSIRKKLPTANMVRLWRWKIPWYKASRSAFLSSTMTSTCDVIDVWWDMLELRPPDLPVRIKYDNFSNANDLHRGTLYVSLIIKVTRWKQNSKYINIRCFYRYVGTCEMQTSTEYYKYITNITIMFLLKFLQYDNWISK